MFVLVAHFRTDSTPAASGAVPDPAAEPLAMLAASPECRRMSFAHSTEAPNRFVLVAEFESAAAYRRALSPFPMRTVVVPWLSTADQQHSEVSEVLLSSVDGIVSRWRPTVPQPGR